MPVGHRDENQLPIGASALDLVRLLSALHGGAVFSFVKYTPRPGASERIRANSEAGFASDDSGAGASERLVSELLRHDPRPSNPTFEIEGERIANTDVSEWLPAVGPREAIGVQSRVVLTRRGRAAHIPMMDFQAAPGDETMRLVIGAMRRSGLEHAAILDSGRSYHAYGFELLSPQAWRRFMYQAILLAPITDTRYIAHRLLEGVSVLRVTAAETKPQLPRVVAVF